MGRWRRGHRDISGVIARAETFAFDGSVAVVGVYSPGGSLQGVLGSDALDPDVRRRLAGADLSVGPSIPLVQIHGSTSVDVTLPVRFGVGFRYLNTERASGETALQRGDVRLGLGGGVRVTIPTTDCDTNTILASSNALTGAGVQAELAGESEARGLRDLAFDLSLGVDRIGGGRVGLKVGYGFRRTRTSDPPLDSAGDLVDVLTDPSLLFKSETIGVFRVGISW